MAFEMTRVVTGPVAEITLSGELDADSAHLFQKQLEATAAGKPTHLVLRMRELVYIASAGIRMLIFAKQRLGSGVAAGYGKVAAVEEIRARHVVPRDQVIYMGDGQSDIPVMLHVNRGEGFTIAASEAREIAQIAKRTVISDDALSVLVPILEEIAGFGPSRIRALFEDQGLVIQEWDRVRTDWLTIRDGAGDGIIRLDAAASAG